MTPPTKIKIGPSTWSMTQVETVDPDTEGWLYGQTRARYSRIRIAKDMSASQRRDTVLHEVLHAVLADTWHGLDGETEERLLRILAPNLLGVLRDNPRLLAFLLDKEV